MSTPQTHPSEEAAVTLERTGRAVVLGTWGCAAITMAGSAASAAVAYDYLGDHWGLGLATGIAVDVALCVALVGDRRLYAHGLASNWGRALRITTALMSLVLNAGVAFAGGRYLLAVLHAFLPVLLVVLTEYGQDVLLKFSALARELAPAEVAPPAVEARDAIHLTQEPPVLPALTPVPVPVAPEAARDRQAAPNVLVGVRQLVAEGLGRQAIAQRLGITQHQARQAIEAIKREVAA